MYANGHTPNIFDACSAIVRQTHDQPSDFHVFRMEVITEGADHDTILGWKVTGVRCMPYVRGENKGKPNYGRRLAQPITTHLGAGKASAMLRQMEQEYAEQHGVGA